jgi:hypothetical protein
MKNNSYTINQVEIFNWKLFVRDNMFRRKLNVIILVAVLFLAGCIGGVVVTEDDEDSGDMTFNHQFEVIEVGGVTGPYSDSYCGIYSFEECHIFVVSISNIGADDLSIAPYWWSAIGDDGETYSVNMKEGLTTIIPGTTTELTLGFDINNGVKLTTLRFNSQMLDSDYEWALDSTDIPSYDIVQSFNVTLNVSASNAENDGDNSNCGFEEDEGCHTLNVTVSNDGLLDFSTIGYRWGAIGDDGIVYEGPDRDGEDKVVAGSTEIVILSFDVPNGVKLTTLQWDDNENSVNCTIPTY